MPTPDPINFDPFTFRSQTVADSNVMFPEITKDILTRAQVAAWRASNNVLRELHPKGMDPALYCLREALFAVAPEIAFREREIFREGLERQLKATGNMDPFELLRRRGRP